MRAGRTQRADGATVRMPASAGSRVFNLNSEGWFRSIRESTEG